MVQRVQEEIEEYKDDASDSSGTYADECDCEQCRAYREKRKRNRMFRKAEGVSVPTAVPRESIEFKSTSEHVEGLVKEKNR